MLKGHSENKLSVAAEELLQFIRPRHLVFRRIGMQHNEPSSSLSYPISSPTQSGRKSKEVNIKWQYSLVS